MHDPLSLYTSGTKKADMVETHDDDDQEEKKGSGESDGAVKTPITQRSHH